MPRHVWTVLCDRIFVDRETNLMNLNVLEQINLGLPAGADGFQQLPFQYHAVSFWIRELDEEATVPLRLRWVDPEGTDLGFGQPIELKFEGQRRARANFGMTSLVYSGHPGVYWLVLETKQEDQWAEVSRLPLEINVTPLNTQSSDETELPSGA